MPSSRSLPTRLPSPDEALASARPPPRRGTRRAASRAGALGVLAALLLPVLALAEGDEGPQARVSLEGTAERTVDGAGEPPVVDELVPTFPQAAARYLGVTDPSGAPGGLALPSQLEWYQLLVAPRLRLDSRVMVRAAPAPVTTTSPRPGVRLDVGGALSQAWRAPGSAFAATGWQVTLGDAPGSARARVALTAAQEIRGTASGEVVTSRFGSRSSASLKVRVAEPVSLTAEAHELSERGAAADAVSTEGARVGAVVGLVPGKLELSATAGADRVHTAADGATIDRSSASVTLSARLTPSLTLSGSEAVQTGDLTPAAGAAQLFPLPPAARITSAAARWRASARLQLTLELAHIATSAGTGYSRQARAEWTPTPGGRLRVAAAYEESLDAASGSRVSRALLQPSLRLTRNASLDASWTDTIQRAPGPVAHAHAVLVSFTVRT